MCLLSSFGPNNVNKMNILRFSYEHRRSLRNQTSLFLSTKSLMASLTSARDTKTKHMGWKLPEKCYCHGS